MADLLIHNGRVLDPGRGIDLVGDVLIRDGGIAAVGPGMACGDVDEAVREVLRGYGYEKQFLHSTGHGVGLEIHEPPWVRRGNDDPLQVGDVVTVEPGVYLPGIGGVRIEDMVAVTESGGHILTASPKENWG